MTNRREAGVRVSFNSVGTPPVKCDRNTQPCAMATVVALDGHVRPRFQRVGAATTTAEGCPVC
jgi:hypothetical protein